MIQEMIEMDTSLEYTEMCLSSTEIQRKWNKKAGDFFINKWLNYRTNKWVHETHVIFECIEDPHHSIPNNFDSVYCWMPRQDQLQDMLNLDLHAMVIELKAFIEWEYYDSLRFTSMEQLWLSFVMYEKFNKFWSGCAWINVRP